MKMALDIWYELWEKTGSQGSTDPYRHPDEQDRSYPWQEDYPTWIKSKEARSDSGPER
jgi:hypothetical protein